MSDLEKVITAAREVVDRASREHGDFSSMHEAYGVLAEEVAEFFEAVRLRESDRSRTTMCRKEAIDVAAVALRIAAQASRLT